MRSISVLGRRGRLTAALAAVAVVAASLVAFAMPASSQSGPSDDCTGDHVFDANPTFGNRTGTIYSVPPTQSRVYSIGAIPAGEYAVTAVAYDGYLTRDLSTPQPSEIWFAEYLDAAGNVLATTGTTGDLADGVLEATWSGSIGSISWSGEDATQIRVVHGARGAASTNSVMPSCIAATAVTTPTVPPTTVPSEPATTIPTEVLPEIIFAPPALPQVETPQFTG